MVDQGPVETHDVSASGFVDMTTESSGIARNASSGMDCPRPVTRSSGLSVDWADAVDDQLMDEAVLREQDTGS